MASILYGLKISYRRPSAWLGTLIGITLAVSLVFGAFMSTDYVGIGTIQKSLEDIRVDMKVEIYSPVAKLFSEYRDYLDEILAVEGVKQVDIFSIVGLPAVLIHENKTSSNISSEFYYGINCFLVNPDSPIEGINITGNPLRGLGLGISLADYLNVSIGENVTLCSGMNNVSVEVSSIMKFGGDYLDTISWLYTYHYQLYSYIPGVVQGAAELDISSNPNYLITMYMDNYSYLQNLAKNLIEEYEGEPELFSTIVIMIFIDRGSLVDIWDLEGSIDRLEHVEDKIRQVLQSEGLDFYINNIVLNRIRVLSITFSYLKLGFAIQLLPIVILGLLLAFITNWITVNKRRREIGLMKVRGMTSRQIFLYLVLEAIIIGAIGGLLGVTLGYISSIYISTNYATEFVELVDPHSIITSFYISYIKSAVIFGAFLGIIAVIIPARNVARLDVEKALAEYVEEVEAEVKVGKILMVLLFISAFGIVELLLGMPTLRFIFIQIQKGKVYILLLLIVFIPIYFFSIFIGPFIFPYAFAKLIASRADKFNKVFSIFARPLSGEMSGIAARNFIRKKTRVYKVVLLIALTLTFGVFYMINNATNRNRTRINLEFYIGADIRVSLSAPVDKLESIRNNLSAIDGVKSMCFVSETSWYEEDRYVQLIVLDANYFDISFVKDSYLDDTNIENAKKVLETSDQVLLSKYYKSM